MNTIRLCWHRFWCLFLGLRSGSMIGNYNPARKDWTCSSCGAVGAYRANDGG